MKRAFFLMLLLTSLFVKAQVINKAEYFIDTDPGQGNGVDIPLATNTAIVSFTASVPTTGLSEGFHNLNIRTRLDNGIWSHYENRAFYLSKFAADAANVKAAEFFIDSDPGNGNGVAIPVAKVGASTSFVATVPTTGLSNGFHNLIIRTKNDLGQWGLGENRVFYTSSTADAADITAAEFFIDTDPGTGNGTTLSVGASAATTTFLASVATTGLANGFHNLFIRTKNSQHVWGHFENRVFYVSNQGLPAADITAMEYFIDTDPGVGNGTAVAVTAGSVVTLVADIPTTGLTPGEHFLFLRAKSADGWGGFEKQPFTIGAAVAPTKPVIASIDNKTTSPALTNINKPVIKGRAEAGVSVEVFNGLTSLGTVTADATGNWAFTPFTALADGTLNISTKAKNASNLESVASDVFVVMIDTQAPAIASIVSIDAKTIQNFVTSNNNPTVVGEAEIASLVEIFNGATKLGEAITNASGNYVFTPTAALVDGNYVITVGAKDVAGNVGLKSAGFSFTIFTLIPTPPVIASIDNKTTSPELTNVNKPVIKGRAEAGVSVEVFNGLTSLGTVTADATGNWAFTPLTALTDGTLNISTKAKNASNLESTLSDVFVVVIDTQAPAIATIVSVDAKTTQNFVTANNKPTVVGEAEIASVVEVFNGTTSLGVINASATGNFTFTPSSALPNGNYVLTAKVKDAAGNVGPLSNTFSFTIGVIVIPIDPLLSANNILTPNGDSKNDLLIIKNIEHYPNNTIKIFDRAGRVVFATTGYKNDWNGSLNGNFLAEDTYYYILDIGGTLPHFKSFITVIRKSTR